LQLLLGRKNEGSSSSGSSGSGSSSSSSRVLCQRQQGGHHSCALLGLLGVCMRSVVLPPAADAMCVCARASCAVLVLLPVRSLGGVHGIPKVHFKGRQGDYYIMVRWVLGVHGCGASSQ
jgi:hypothetical protein